MKKIIFSALLAISTAFASGSSESFDRSTENRTPGTFYGLIVNANANVIITQGEYSSVRIEGDKSSVDGIHTDVQNGALVINGSTNHAVDIFITTDELNMIEVNGSAKIFGDGTFNTDIILLKVNGSGSIKMDIRSLTVGMIVKGSGKIIASGSTGNSFVKVFGTGNVYASSLNSLSYNEYTTSRASAEVKHEKRSTLKLHR